MELVKYDQSKIYLLSSVVFLAGLYVQYGKVLPFTTMHYVLAVCAMVLMLYFINYITPSYNTASWVLVAGLVMYQIYAYNNVGNIAKSLMY